VCFVRAAQADTPRDVAELIAACWRGAPDERPTMDGVVAALQRCLDSLVALAAVSLLPFVTGYSSRIANLVVLVVAGCGAQERRSCCCCLFGIQAELCCFRNEPSRCCRRAGVQLRILCADAAWRGDGRAAGG
jgi:hypothetical protein